MQIVIHSAHEKRMKILQIVEVCMKAQKYGKHDEFEMIF